MDTEQRYEHRFMAAVIASEGARQIFFLLYAAQFAGLRLSIDRLVSSLAANEQFAHLASDYSVGCRVNELVKAGIAKRSADGSVELVPPPKRAMVA